MNKTGKQYTIQLRYKLSMTLCLSAMETFKGSRMRNISFYNNE